jgi:hypothetical protein
MEAWDKQQSAVQTGGKPHRRQGLTGGKASPADKNRWVMDPGSNVHICNSTGANWKQTTLPTPQDTVQPGCNSHRVEAWGEVTLDVKRGNETASITLKKVAYIPGFIANIFSLSCCKKIYFNSKTNTLFKDDESIFSDLN